MIQREVAGSSGRRALLVEVEKISIITMSWTNRSALGKSIFLRRHGGSKKKRKTKVVRSNRSGLKTTSDWIRLTSANRG